MRRYLRAAWHVSPGAAVARWLTHRRAVDSLRAVHEYPADAEDALVNCRCAPEPRYATTIDEILALASNPDGSRRFYPPCEHPATAQWARHVEGLRALDLSDDHPAVAHALAAIGRFEIGEERAKRDYVSRYMSRDTWRCFAPCTASLAGLPCQCTDLDALHAKDVNDPKEDE